MGLTLLNNFLEKDKDNEINNSYATIEYLLKNHNSLLALQPFVSMSMYEEEQKKKKGQPAIIDTTSEKIRFAAIKSLSLFAKCATNASETNARFEYANIPNILSTLCVALNKMFSLYELSTVEMDKTKYTLVIQELFICTLTALEYGSETIPFFLSTNVVGNIKTMLLDSSFTVPCLKILKYLTTQQVGLQVVSAQDLMDIFSTILESSLKNILVGESSSTAATAPSTKKGKGGPGPAGKGGGEGDRDKEMSPRGKEADGKVNHLVAISTIVSILTAISCESKDSLDCSYVSRVVPPLAHVALSREVWKGINFNSNSKSNEYLCHLVEDICIFFGNLGFITSEIRDYIADSGAIRVLLQLLISSKDVCGLSVQPVADKSKVSKDASAEVTSTQTYDESKLQRLHRTRHVIEKSMLHLACATETNQDLISSSNRGRYRSSFCTHTVALKSTTNITDVNIKSKPIIDELSDLILSDDLDISQRAVRLITTFLQSHNAVDVAHVISESQLNISLNSKLSKIFSWHAQEIISCAKTGATVASGILAIVPPNSHHSICNLLISIEILLKSAKDCITAFAMDENIDALCDILYFCGPITKLKSVSDSAEELQLDVVDARCFDWNGNRISDQVDQLIIRELALDVLTIIAEGDIKYRVYENELLPQQPLCPFPEFTSPLLSSSKLVFSKCSNPTVSILNLYSYNKIENGNIFAIPQNGISSLEENVCVSALRLLETIAGSGIVGLSELYGAISSGYGSNHDIIRFSPLLHLKEFLIENFPAEAVVDVNEPYAWKFPIHFEGTSGTVVTSTSDIFARKDIWVYIPVASALLGILSNPSTTKRVAQGAIMALSNLSRISNIVDTMQPVVTDYFSACTLGLGGSVILAGCIGSFGTIPNYDIGEAVALYIFNRGGCREKFWEENARTTASLTQTSNTDVKQDKGKAAKGKDVKADKGKGKDVKKDDKKQQNQEVSIPYEPDASHPDPNHGPDSKQWKSYLDIGTCDLHNCCSFSSPITSCIQGGFISGAISLIEGNSDVNISDNNGITPLMHAIMLREYDVVKLLINAGVNINAIDASGNPTIKYCFFALTNSTAESIPSFFSRCSPHVSISLAGGEFALCDLVDAHVDVNVSDVVDGNYPIHFATGIGSLNYIIGGRLTAISIDFNTFDELSSKEILNTVCAAGASIDSVNFKGMTALHVFAGRGMKYGIEFCVGLNALSNITDNDGFTPLHYIAGCCPPDCNNLFNKLLSYGDLHPMTSACYTDNRRGKSDIEKYALDAKKIIDDSLRNVFSPKIVELKRVFKQELLNSRTKEGFTPLSLCLLGGVLTEFSFFNLLTDNSLRSDYASRRVQMIDYIYAQSQEIFYDQLQGVTSICPVQMILAFYAYLNQANAIYPQSASHDELNAIIDSSNDYNLFCTLKTTLPSFPPVWTPLHCAILCGNIRIAETALSKSSIFEFPYVHFMAGITNVEAPIVNAVVRCAASSPVHGTLLNISNTPYEQCPLVIAVTKSNSAVVRAILSYPQSEPNAVDAKTRRTAFHIACLNENTIILNTFSTFSDRLDFMLEDIDGKTCIDSVICSKNLELLDILTSMRRNDVTERLLSSSEDKISMLMELENENVELNKVSIGNDGEFLPFSDLQEKLEKSERFLSRILSNLQEDANIVSRDMHAHDCFYEGMTYKEYLEQKESDVGEVNSSEAGILHDSNSML